MEILIVRFSSLGDLILTLPTVTALKQHYPNAHITFLTKERFAEIPKNHPGVDRVAVEAESDAGIGKVIKVRRKLNPRYDLVLDLHATAKSRLLTRLIKTDALLTYNKGTIARRLLVRTGIRWGDFPHVVDRYLASLKQLGIQAAVNARPQINPPPTAHEEADVFLAKHDIPSGAPLVGMSPMATWPTKRWPAQSYAQLAKKVIDDLGIAVILFGSAPEWEPLEAIRQNVGRGIVNAAGLPSLMTTAALMARTQVFVSNDSGPVHLAAAVDVPVVAFFGPTVTEFGFEPRGPANVVLERDLPCRPCSLHGGNSCRLKTLACLKEISPELAFQAVVERL